MATTKSSVVLVPGAWHSPDAYAPLTSQLEAAGYTVRGVTLPSVGADPPVEDFNADIDAVRTTIETAINNEEDVLVFMHSYGSVPAGEAVHGLDKLTRRKEGKRGGVAHLFYCSAFALPKGTTLFDACGGNELPWWDVAEDKMSVKPIDPAHVFYHDISKEEQEKQISKLQPQSYKAWFSKTTWEPYRDIPATYMFCENDNAIPIEAQKRMVENSKGVKWETVDCDASHCPFLSQADKTARAVRKAAGENV